MRKHLVIFFVCLLIAPQGFTHQDGKNHDQVTPAKDQNYA